MPTLDDALGHLEGLRDHPPSPAPPADELRERAQRIRRRRRGARSAGLIAAGLLAVGVAVGTDGEPTVQTEPSPTTTAREPKLTVEPSEDLRPNQLVTITLPPEADETNLIFAECGREATGSNPEAWCQILSTSPTETGRGYQVRVRRVISTTNGRIDCAEEPGRCVLGVRAGQDFTAPISFDPDLGPLTPPTLDVTRASPTHVTVTGEGYEPGAEVMVTQCRPWPDASESTFSACDRHRAVTVVADEDGAFTAEVDLYREIYEDYRGWAPCEPCQVQALTPTAEPQPVEVDAAAGLGGRPTVEIRPAGPYRPGELVELHGSGFAPNTSDIFIGWCRFSGASPEIEAQGLGPGYAECAYPGIAQPLVTDDQGSFAISGFPLPDGPFGPSQASCIGETVRCGLAWHPGEGALPYFVTEFVLTGADAA